MEHSGARGTRGGAGLVALAAHVIRMVWSGSCDKVGLMACMAQRGSWLMQQGGTCVLRSTEGLAACSVWWLTVANYSRMAGLSLV